MVDHLPSKQEALGLVSCAPSSVRWQLYNTVRTAVKGMAGGTVHRVREGLVSGKVGKKRQGWDSVGRVYSMQEVWI